MHPSENQSRVVAGPGADQVIERNSVTRVQSYRLQVGRPIHPSWLFRSDKAALSTNQQVKGQARDVGLIE